MPRSVLRSASLHVLLSVVAPTRPVDLPEPPPPVDAAALALDLRWDAPDGCPARVDVVTDLERLTDRVMDPSAPDAVIVDAIVERDAEGYALRMSRRAGEAASEVRSLKDVDCELLARAAALVIAVDLAPVATAERTRVDPDEAVADGSPGDPAPADVIEARDPIGRAPPPRTPPSSRGSRPAARSPWTHRFVAAARGGLALGIVPGVSGSVGGMLGWGVGPIRLEVVGLHTLRRTAAVIDGASIRASSSGGGVHLLYAPVVGPVSAVLGGGLEAGVLAGRGVGEAVRARPVRAPWSAVAIVVGLAWPAEGRVALSARAEALLSTVRPALHLGGGPTGDVPAFRVPPAGLRVMIGPEIRLP